MNGLIDWFEKAGSILSTVLAFFALIGVILTYVRSERARGRAEQKDTDEKIVASKDRQGMREDLIEVKRDVSEVKTFVNDLGRSVARLEGIVTTAMQQSNTLKKT